LDADYQGEDMQIGFNYQYLLDFLEVAGETEKVRMELKDDQSAGQFRPEEEDASHYRYVVMPMRV
jgi:DNA polymerase III subunit beta